MNSLYSALSDIPFDVQDDAKEILNAMLTSSDTIGWDAKLQLIVDGRVIPKTNVSELVVHVLYPTMNVSKNLKGSTSLFKD